jgi:site-specific DNA recombinase
MKKKWLYIRVSTLEQANNWFWKDLQLTEIQRYLKYNYWENVEYEIYSDLRISWWKDESERPWLKKMINDIEDWIIDTVIVWKLNRLARKTIILLELVEFL